MNLDRTKQALAAFVLAQFPQIDYLALYGGKVVAQGGANAFDFQPDDPRIPGVSGVPIKLPFPGFALTLDPTQSPRALLGWQNGDPSLPELRLWESPGLAQMTVSASQQLTFSAPAVNLGQAPTQPLVLGTVFTVALATLLGVLSAAFTAIAAGFAAGAVAWTAAGGLLPVLAAPAGVVAPVYTATATACTAAVTALGTFLSTLSQSLSTVSKTQ